MLTTYTKDASSAAKACVIWLHGLGADGANMMGVADVFPPGLPIKHVFVDAQIRPVTLNNHIPMRAWYDITGLTLLDREDRHGILQSEQQIEEIIQNEIVNQGFKRTQIYLAGFSQGGAMALFMGMRAQEALGGVMSLSSYLPLHAECLRGNQLSLPIFMAAGSLDQVVLPTWTKAGYDFVKARGYTQVTWKEYRMEHLMCMEEITDVACWLEKHITLAAMPGETL